MQRLGQDCKSYSSESALEIYKITKKEAELADTALYNSDVWDETTTEDHEVAYRAYYELEKSITSRNGDDAILYDLAADFSWHGGLSDAIEKLEKEGN